MNTNGIVNSNCFFFSFRLKKKIRLLINAILSTLCFYNSGHGANAALTASFIESHGMVRIKEGVQWRTSKAKTVSPVNNKNSSRFVASLCLQHESWNEAGSLRNRRDTSSTSYYLHDCKDNSNGVPRHVGIVLDGNGRWAQQHNLPVSIAHMKGADRALQLIPFLQSSGIKCCTLYCFSTENWSRSEQEVMNILSILEQTLTSELENDKKNRGIRVKIIGSREKLPPSLQKVLDRIEASTENQTESSHLTMCLAINYGGRRDIITATKNIIKAVQIGEISDPATQVTEALFSSYLSTNALPDLDLIIRTGGDQRLSNFLLWDAAYAELYFTDVLWPDFDENCLKKALEWFSKRDRRFGGRKPHEDVALSPDN